MFDLMFLVFLAALFTFSLLFLLLIKFFVLWAICVIINQPLIFVNLISRAITNLIIRSKEHQILILITEN